MKNQVLTTGITLSETEIELVSGGNGASDAVSEEQIETVVITGSSGPSVSSGGYYGASVGGGPFGIMSIWGSTGHNGRVNEAADAITNDIGVGLSAAGKWMTRASIVVGAFHRKTGAGIGVGGVALETLGESLQYQEP